MIGFNFPPWLEWLARHKRAIIRALVVLVLLGLAAWLAGCSEPKATWKLMCVEPMGRTIVNGHCGRVERVCQFRNVQTSPENCGGPP